MIRKLLFLFACAVTTVTAWGQSTGVVSSHSVDENDATTYVIKGHGNINDILGANEKYIFNYDASLDIYTSNEGVYNLVYQNTEYDPAKTYYTRENVYSRATAEPTWRDSWTFKQNLYSINGATYSLVYANTELQNGTSYATLTNAGTQVNDLTSYLVEMDPSDYAFSSTAQNKVYYYDVSNINYKHFQSVSNGEIYDANKKYYIFTDGNSYGKDPYAKSNIQLYVKEGDNYKAITDNEITDGGTYFKMDSSNKNPGQSDYTQTEAIKGTDYTIYGTECAQYADLETYLLTKQFSGEIYSLNNNTYKNVNGTPYDSNANLTYYSGVTFTNLTEEEVKSETYTTYAKKITGIAYGTTSFYTFDGTSYKAVSNNNTYIEPVEGESQYYTVTDLVYTARNLDYLKTTTGSNNGLYVSLASGSTTFWNDIVSDINENINIEKVVFQSDNGDPVIVGNTVTQAMMLLTKVYTLDMSATQISKIATPYMDATLNGMTTKGTFVIFSDVYKSNNCIETLFTPQVIGTTDEEKTLSWAVFEKLPKLRYLYLSDGIETLGNKSLTGNSYKLSSITFPNTLKYIKSNSVDGHFNASMTYNSLTDHTGAYIKYIETLTFPSSLLEIETNAFSGTCPKDVFFLGVEAPRTARHAWGDDAYISNNAFEPSTSTTIGTDDANKVTVNVANGEATRANYVAQSGWLAMLHYPSACTASQAAKYTDITRDYRRVSYNTYGYVVADPTNGIECSGPTTSATDPDMSFDGTYTWYTAGKETNNITGFSQATTNAALKKFGNEYPWPSAQFTAEEYPEGYFGGDYSGGYYDYALMGEYHWPSISMAYRATVVAQNALIWDGVSTIGDGIRFGQSVENPVPADSYVGDGSEYEGLHQFVFTANDVADKTTTNTWDMSNYADGKWHTICLPFNMTKGQMKEVFGKNAEGSYDHIRLCMFSGVIRNHDKITLQFNDERFSAAENDNDIVLQAHVSYMIRAEKTRVVAENEPTAVFNYYQMVSGAPITTKVISHSDYSEGDANYAEPAEYRFVGNYQMYSADGSRVYMPENTYFFSKTYSKFRFQTGKTGKWNPYTSVVEVPEGDKDKTAYFSGSGDQAKVSTFMWGDEDPEATGIQNVAIVADNELIYTNSAVYNVNGQKVGNSLEGLPTGLYIVNGKKYFIK